MTDQLLPRRSVLYMPGANERALEKAKTIPADALILDLEDAVAPDAKAEARERVCAAAASERLTVLVMGTNDLAKELQAVQIPGREPLLPALAMCLLGARAAGKVILDGVYNDIKDPDGFHAECVQARHLGFDGKTLIHPSQVDDANQVWAPSEEAIEDARALIATFDAALAEGKGVVTHNGRMIENLHVANAQRVLAVADAIAARS